MCRRATASGRTPRLSPLVTARGAPRSRPPPMTATASRFRAPPPPPPSSRCCPSWSTRRMGLPRGRRCLTSTCSGSTPTTRSWSTCWHPAACRLTTCPGCASRSPLQSLAVRVEVPWSLGPYELGDDRVPPGPLPRPRQHVPARRRGRPACAHGLRHPPGARPVLLRALRPPRRPPVRQAHDSSRDAHRQLLRRARSHGRTTRGTTTRSSAPGSCFSEPKGSLVPFLDDLDVEEVRRGVEERHLLLGERSGLGQPRQFRYSPTSSSNAAGSRSSGSTCPATSITARICARYSPQ